MASDCKTKPVVDLLWGASEIAGAIGRTPRQVNNLLERRILPARKIGNRWCITREALVNFFTSPDTRAA